MFEQLAAVADSAQLWDNNHQPQLLARWDHGRSTGLASPSPEPLRAADIVERTTAEAHPRPVDPHSILGPQPPSPDTDPGRTPDRSFGLD